MIQLSVDTASIQDLEALQADLRQAAREVSANSGLLGLMTQGILQIDRFVANNIEVDTGRTKNSVFPTTRQNGNSVLAQLSTNVSYAPYVREAGHGEQFLAYAEQREVPGVVAWIGEQAGIKVEAVLSK